MLNVDLLMFFEVSLMSINISGATLKKIENTKLLINHSIEL
jgi:hypothetical protein